MGLFGKKDKQRQAVLDNLDNLMPEVEADPVNYNTVTDWLVGLSDEDYTKVCDVAKIYRQANVDTCKVLGVPNEPSTFITPPQPPEAPEAPAHSSNFLDDDDDLSAAFLEDEIPAKNSKKSKSKKVIVKDVSKN